MRGQYKYISVFVLPGVWGRRWLELSAHPCFLCRVDVRPKFRTHHAEREWQETGEGLDAGVRMDEGQQDDDDEEGEKGPSG